MTDDPASTPAAWPAILLERAGADRSDGPRRGRRGPARSTACAARSATSARPATIATIARVRPARPRRRRLPDRPRSGGPRPGHAAAAALRRRQRLRRGPGGRHGPDSSWSATRTRSSRARRSPPSRSAPSEAIIAVRAEATETIRRLEAAIGAAEEAGFIGLRRPRLRARPRRSRVRPVQGAYMLGEETVLLKALEGKRGQPEQRPPHPAERGLFGMPTVVHNVQTLAAVPWILRQRRRGVRRDRRAGQPGHDPRPGPGAGRRRASPRSRSGRRCARSSALGGAAAGGRSVKARPRRRPVGRAPAARAARHAVRRSRPLRAAGAHIGSGSVVVADDRACIVDLARLLTRFCADEACGKTIPCRIGTRRAQRDRRPGRDRPARSPPTSQLLADLSADIVGVRPVRPRAPGDPPVRERDAILPVRARRAHPAQLLPGRRLPPDRGGRRRGPLTTTMADLITRPDTAARRDRAARRFARRAPARRPSRRSARSRRRASGSRSTAGSSRASRARRSSRSAATTGSRSRPSATSPSCPASGPAGCASSRSRARSTRRSAARARASRR